MTTLTQRLFLLCLPALWSMAAPALSAADLLLENARVYTADPQQPWAEVIAIEGDTLSYVGAADGAAAHIDAGTRRVDMGGRLVLPGFIDTHMHVASTFPTVHAAKLGPEMSPEEVLAAVAAHAAAYPQQNPVIGNGFLGAAFGKQGPTAEQLDEVVSDRPVILIDEGGHTAWINTAAMRKVGLTGDTQDPQPGRHYYKRYPDGRPTGWLIESDAFEWVIEKLGGMTPELLARGADSFLQTMSAMGITAAFDAGMGVDEMNLSLMDRLVAEDDLPLRIVGSHYVNNETSLGTALSDLASLQDRFHSEFFDLRVLKISLDGTVEAQTAFMLEPYREPEGHMAELLVPAAQARAVVLQAARDDTDVHLHTLGDAAVRLGLDMVEQVRAQVPDSDSRFTLCHVQIVNPDDVSRFGSLGVIAQSTPTWYVYDDIAEEFLGKERLAQHYPLASIAAGGARVTLGSDYPASWIGLDGLNPLYNIEMAMTRQPAGDSDFPVQPKASERISLEQAIKGYTRDAAYQLRLENSIGSLEAGKQADLVVLSDNLFEMDVYRIHEAEVEVTVMDGQLVHGSWD